MKEFQTGDVIVRIYLMNENNIQMICQASHDIKLNNLESGALI